MMNAPVHAPELALPGVDWLNVSQPLDLASLRGRIVVLDFWTYCCINCMHIIPTLQYIERQFSREVVVIGIHSPKFDAEKKLQNLSKAIARYGVTHPVIHDPELNLWDVYAVKAWPTLVFIGPDGHILGQSAGEPDPAKLHELISGLVANATQDGSLSPMNLTLSPMVQSADTFSFPGKIKTFEEPQADGSVFALADSGNHQIVLLNEKGEETVRIGTGYAGFSDGIAGEASFHSPQGLVCSNQKVFVADTGNHALRTISLLDGKVSTLCGTSKRGPALDEKQVATGLSLASPWDLEIDRDQLIFANAGTHQIAAYSLADHTVRLLAGTGDEGLRDGPALSAHLAQPSGLTFDSRLKRLYFVDSETSSIRYLDIMNNLILTLAGEGLFSFGERDGEAKDALFQHPLGLSLSQDGLIIADSYNNSLRSLNVATGQVGQFDGGHFECSDPICLPLDEPAGLCTMPNGDLIVSDTNNHRLLRYKMHNKTYGRFDTPPA